MKIKYFLLAGAVFCSLFTAVNLATAQGTAFVYQGQLNSGGTPANGKYDLTAALFNAGSGGGQVGNTLTNAATVVSNGTFNVTLNFGSGIFTGSNLWMQIGVRTNGSGAFTTLSPRQQVMPVPYAIMANTASNLLGTLSAGQLSGALPSSQLAGTYSGAVTLSNATNQFSGAFTGKLAGNAATATTATNFSGNLSGDVTGTQGATVVAKVGGQTVANVASATSAANAATNANTASTIVKRDASGNFSAGTITATTFTGNLTGNAATATTATNFTGSLSGDVTGTQAATVVAKVGGQTAANVASATSAANAATNANTVSTIVKRDASGSFSAGTITATNFTGNGGNLTNLNASQLASGTVPSARLSGTYSNAVTFNNNANSFKGSFTGSNLSVTNLSIRDWNIARGFTYQGVSVPGLSFTNGGVLRMGIADYGTTSPGSSDQGGVLIVGTSVIDGSLQVNDNINAMGDICGATFCGSSDRNLKEKVVPINGRGILESVVGLPISSWNFKKDAATRHIGPMAQDFYAAFNVGPDDKHITTVDEGGVALAAIQGLNQKLEEQVKAKDEEIQTLKQRLDKLEHMRTTQNR